MIVVNSLDSKPIQLIFFYQFFYHNKFSLSFKPNKCKEVRQVVLQIQQGTDKMPEAGGIEKKQPENFRLQLHQGPRHGRLYRKN